MLVPAEGSAAHTHASSPWAPPALGRSGRPAGRPVRSRTLAPVTLFTWRASMSAAHTPAPASFVIHFIYIYIYSTSGYTVCMPAPASFVIHDIYIYCTSVHIVYKSILTSQFIPSPSPLVYICFFFMSVSLSLLCKQVCRYWFSFDSTYRC